jgi:hypothetical protein
MNTSISRFQWIGIVALVIIASAYTWATWRYFTEPLPGGNDFLTHYGAWEAYLRYGLNPYSDEAALHTQMEIYGRPARPSEDQNRMVYPFYSILLHGPFVYIQYSLARAIYMTLLQAALFAGVIMTLALVRWKLPVWMLACVLVWSLLYYPAARDVILGQFALFGFFALAGALFLLKRGQDAAGGTLLVLATFKPTLVFLVIPFLLLWAVVRRRWRFVAGFMIALGILSLGSSLLLPTWIGNWLYRIGRYSEYTVGQSPVWLLTHTALPALEPIGERMLAGLLVAGMAWTWWRALRPEGDIEFHWALGVTLVVSNLIVSRSATTNYVLMFVTTLWVFAALDRLGRHGRIIVIVLMAISLVGHWWLHLATVVGNQEQPILFLPWPVVLGLVLCLGRAWLLRDARQAQVWP